MSVRPAKTQISLGIRSLIRVFAVRMKKAWVLSYPLSAQWRLWSDWADAQADLSLRWAHNHIVGFCHEVAHMNVLIQDNFTQNFIAKFYHFFLWKYLDSSPTSQPTKDFFFIWWVFYKTDWLVDWLVGLLGQWFHHFSRKSNCNINTCCWIVFNVLNLKDEILNYWSAAFIVHFGFNLPCFNEDLYFIFEMCFKKKF